MRNSKGFKPALEERLAAARVAVGADFGKLEQYYSLLTKWNKTINLTSLPLPDFPAATLDRLIVEPLAAAQMLRDEPIGWVDLGSGGGSPAVPLKVARPAMRLTMVESNERKCAFLRETVRALNLGSVNVLTSRIETLPEEPAGVALVTLRAVRVDERIREALYRLLAANGRLLRFGTDSAAELQGFRAVLELQLTSTGRLSVLEKV